MSGLGHGEIGTRVLPFTNLLPLRTVGYNPHNLALLAEAIKSNVDSVSDGPDPEENVLMPSGYTYFGQFIDHDLTFDNSSSLNPADEGTESRLPANLRTPRFDLDSVYGDGPNAMPFMYAGDGASLLLKDGAFKQGDTKYTQAFRDLLRSPNGRAIIGDKRNDENSIVSQIQQLFVRYHNVVVAAVHAEHPTLSGTGLFSAAQAQVRWTYQTLVIKDFLPRIVAADVFLDLEIANFDALKADWKPATIDVRRDRYALYTEDIRKNLPREFVVAAYRFGHSGVRQGYRLNTETLLDIFPSSTTTDADEVDPTQSLLGFNPLPESHVIDDWARFFPAKGPAKPGTNPDGANRKAEDTQPDPKVRLQFAYKLDTTLVDPIGALPPTVLPTSNDVGGAVAEAEAAIAPDPLPVPGRPSLALLNLLRGNVYKVQGGQAIVDVLKQKGLPVTPLDPQLICIRKQTSADGVSPKIYVFQHVDEIIAAGQPPVLTDTAEVPSAEATFAEDSPLWFYILAEAQAHIVQKLGVDTGFEPFSEDLLLNGGPSETQLGWVGGRIIAEVFYGLMDSDEDSFVNSAPHGWTPMLGGREHIFASLIRYVLEAEAKNLPASGSPPAQVFSLLP